MSDQPLDLDAFERVMQDAAWPVCMTQEKLLELIKRARSAEAKVEKVRKIVADYDYCTDWGGAYDSGPNLCLAIEEALGGQEKG